MVSAVNSKTLLYNLAFNPFLRPNHPPPSASDSVVFLRRYALCKFTYLLIMDIFGKILLLDLTQTVRSGVQLSSWHGAMRYLQIMSG